MLKCENGHVFDEEDAETYQDHMGVTDPYPVYVTFLKCPVCGNTETHYVEEDEDE